MSRRKWLVLFVEIDEEKIKMNKTKLATDVPNAVQKAVDQASGGAANLQGLYLVGSQLERNQLEALVQDASSDMHHHAVNDLGEVCTENNCLTHPRLAKVLNLHDRRQGRQDPD